MHIQECIDESILNKVSVFPNFEQMDLSELFNNNNIRVSLHLNLVEGKCLSNHSEIELLVDEDGNFKHDFGGLFLLNLIQKKQLEAQVYKEIKSQILFWKKILPKGKSFCIDSHQHVHMIPSIFKTVLRVIDEAQIPLEYLRIPAEPILPYITTPSLFLSYNAINILKQWVLKFLWLCNQKHVKPNERSNTYFFGILFSGKMDETRVKKILPKYIKLANKNKKDIEVLFHPGYIPTTNKELPDTNIVFHQFYLSKNRKTEYDSLMKLKERRL